MVFASPSRTVEASTQKRTFKEMNTRVALAAVAVGAALLGGAAHAVGTAPSAGADTGTDLDPLEDLFGTGGINTWTTTADTDLATLSPTLAGDFDTNVDNFPGGGFFLMTRSPSWPTF
jgi:hypothetical protein